MKTRVAIAFWPMKGGAPKLLPETPVAIYCRITVAGRKIEYSTGLRTTYGNWISDGEHGRVKGRTQADKHINTQLTKLRDELTDIWADLERQGKPVTARRIIKVYQNGGAVLDMLGLYDAFLAERKTLIGLEISESSYLVTLHRRKVLAGFLEANKLLDLRPEEFKHSMADRFIYWGLTEKGYKRSNINKALQNVIQALRWAVQRELLDKNPVEIYKYKSAAKAEIKFLNVGELQQLTAQVLPTACLERTRDSFVFQCWTGLAYADLAALDVARDARYHREKGSNSLRRVLHITRAKSTMQKGYECVIPLLPEAERILAKYDDELPVPSNQAYNRYLKELGQLCGFDADKMTSHVGRKTAGVMMLNLGIRMETVSKFLGHSSVKMTEKLYAKILDTTVVDDFGKLFGPSEALAPPRVYELPAPRPEPIELRSARRLSAGRLLPSTPEVESGSWRRPAPVTSRGAQKGGLAA